MLVIVLAIVGVIMAMACEASEPAPLISQHESVNIDQLVNLAEENILAADQYKGQWVVAHGVVGEVTEDEINVVGLGAADSPFGIESAASGFSCKYDDSLQSKALGLRQGDRITVSGKLTRWFTTFIYQATIKPCSF